MSLPFVCHALFLDQSVSVGGKNSEKILGRMTQQNSETIYENLKETSHAIVIKAIE